MVIRLEGRVAGPWATELVREWNDKAPMIDQKKVSLDLRNITYIDGRGMQALRDIYDQTHAELIASTPWTRYLAEEVTRTSVNHVEEEL